MIYIDVDTAVTVPANVMPLIDDTDFKTRETSVAYNAAGMDLVWNFVTPDGTITQTAVTPTTGGDYDWSHTGDGMYQIEIPASGGASINNDTEGTGYFTGVCDGVYPWRGPNIVFRAAGLNDLLIENAYSATRGLAGTALPAAAADAAGGLVISDAGGLDIDSVLSGNVPQTGDSYARIGVNGAGLTNIVLPSGGLANVTAWTVDITGNLTGNVTGSVANVTGGINTAAGTITTLDALDTAQDSQHSTTQTAIGNLNNISTAQVNAEVDTAISDAALATAAALAAAQADLDTITDTGVVATNMRGTDGAYTGTPPTAAQVRAEIDSNSTQIAAIVADTNELQTNQGDWATATGFSTHSAADVWASGTRTLTAFTFAVDVANDGLDSVTLPANIITGTSIAASALDGKGDWNTTTPLDAGDIRDAVGLASANLDTQLGTIDTEVGQAKAVTDKLDDTLEDDGGTYRFTENALEEAPSGGGGSSSNPTTLQSTTIATLASQTSFTLTAGSADDDAYNGCMVVLTDQATSTQKAVGRIGDYTGSTKTVTLDAAPAFTIATGDSVDILAMGDTRAASIDTILARTGQGITVNTQRQADSNYNFPSAIVRGTDYNSTAGNAWTWTLTGFPASPWQSGTTGTLEFKQGCETSWTEVGTVALSHDGDETLTPSASFTDTESSSLTAGVSTCYRLTLTNGTNTWVTTGSWSVTD